jgi:hypothetical protein
VASKSRNAFPEAGHFSGAAVLWNNEVLGNAGVIEVIRAALCPAPPP